MPEQPCRGNPLFAQIKEKADQYSLMNERRSYLRRQADALEARLAQRAQAAATAAETDHEELWHTATATGPSKAVIAEIRQAVSTDSPWYTLQLSAEARSLLLTLDALLRNMADPPAWLSGVDLSELEAAAEQRRRETEFLRDAEEALECVRAELAVLEEAPGHPARLENRHGGAAGDDPPAWIRILEKHSYMERTHETPSGWCFRKKENGHHLLSWPRIRTLWYHWLSGNVPYGPREFCERFGLSHKTPDKADDPTSDRFRVLPGPPRIDLEKAGYGPTGG